MCIIVKGDLKELPKVHKPGSVPQCGTVRGSDVMWQRLCILTQRWNAECGSLPTFQAHFQPFHWQFFGSWNNFSLKDKQPFSFVKNKLTAWKGEYA